MYTYTIQTFLENKYILVQNSNLFINGGLGLAYSVLKSRSLKQKNIRIKTLINVRLKKSKLKEVSTQSTTIVNASEKAWNLKLDVTKKSELNGVASMQESFFAEHVSIIKVKTQKSHTIEHILICFSHSSWHNLIIISLKGGGTF